MRRRRAPHCQLYLISCQTLMCGGAERRRRCRLGWAPAHARHGRQAGVGLDDAMTSSSQRVKGSLHCTWRAFIVQRFRGFSSSWADPRRGKKMPMEPWDQKESGRPAVGGRASPLRIQQERPLFPTFGVEERSSLLFALAALRRGASRRRSSSGTRCSFQPRRRGADAVKGPGAAVPRTSGINQRPVPGATSLP